MVIENVKQEWKSFVSSPVALTKTLYQFCMLGYSRGYLIMTQTPKLHILVNISAFMFQTPQKWLKVRPALYRAELYCTPLKYQSYILILRARPRCGGCGGRVKTHTLPALIWSKWMIQLIIREHYGWRQCFTSYGQRGFQYFTGIIQAKWLLVWAPVPFGGTAVYGGGEGWCCSSQSWGSGRCRERPGLATSRWGQLVVSLR